MKPCIECGEVSEDSRCDEHKPTEHRRGRPSRSVGYDAVWDRLSRRARRLQPFCSDCGTVDNLTADHSPRAWQRKAEGKPIRLTDIDVVCRDCNIRRGPARGDGVRRDDRVAAAVAATFTTRGDAPPPPLAKSLGQPQRGSHIDTMRNGKDE